MGLPPRLYKYRPFDVNTLRMFCDASVYYADPRKFNDPLECRPLLEKGVRREEIEDLCRKMLEENYCRNKQPNPVQKATDQLEMLRRSSEEADKAKRQDYYMRLLGSKVKELLANEMAPCGVLSLCKRWNSPLMWSHYAAGQTGLCVEFSTAGHGCQELRKVAYGDGAILRSTDLIRWKLQDDKDAKQRIVDAFFYSKASAWKYEMEWRDVCPMNGSKSLPFHIHGIYFGFACEPWVRGCIVKLLDGSPCEPTKYYEMIRKSAGHIVRRELDSEELKAEAMRSSPHWDFAAVVSA